jgi:tripartite-type tricarboxylate transporter receptor subunit TctC
MLATRLALVFTLCGALCVATTAQAQGTASAYPNRPLRLVVPLAPGGMVDTVARTVAQHLAERLGQPVVTENRPGANGVVALEIVMKSPPDGYTLVMTTQAMLVFNMNLYKKLPYEALRDFSSVTTLFAAPLYFVVTPSLAAQSVPELIALARSQPGKLSYASIGIGSGQHLAMELFKARTGLDIVHIPYKSSTSAMADLLTGRVQMMFEGPTSTLPQIRSGKLRALASLGPRRTAAMPELPTISEAGVPGFQILTWFGLSVPAGVPRPIVDRLNREVGDLLRSSATREKFAASNIEFIPSTPDEMDERIRTEIPVFMKLMRDAGIEPE